MKMKNAISSICLTILWTAAFGKDFVPSPRVPQEIMERQAMSYTTNVVHQDPRNPDLTAQSSINVNFNTKPSSKIPSESIHGHTYHPVPKTIRNYQQNSFNIGKQSNTKPVLQKNLQGGDTQSFNVGYSVSFKGDNLKGRPKFAIPQSISKEGDIITGTRKGQELVEKPNFPNDDFLNNPLFDIQKRKIPSIPQPSNIKPQTFPDFFQKNSNLESHANLSPLTQGYFSNLNQKKETAQIPDFQQNDIPSNFHNSPWQNLSPGVEIAKSKGYQTNHQVDFQTPSNYYQQAKQFDHKGALGQSLGFDYSNAVDAIGQIGGQAKQQLTSSGPVLFDSKTTSNQLSPQISVPPDTTGFYNAIAQFSNLQSSASSFNPQEQKGNKEIQIPQQSLIGGSSPKLPLDTRLLRNPVLITDTVSLRPDTNVVPIHYDTHLIKDAVNKQIINYAQPSDLFHQTQIGTPSSFNNFEDHRQDYRPQPTQALKVYGKPQPNEQLLGLIRDEQKPDTDHLLRRPRYNMNVKLRPDFNIETHLRPPPLAGEYQRKVFNKY